jgi:putative DNA primase/helicase
MPDIPKIVFTTEKIPAELKQRRQWINWKYGPSDNKGKLTKIPVAPWATGHDGPASVTDPQNLTTFEEAVKTALARRWGIGFAFYKGARIVGIDLDKIEPEADEIIKQANSYTERSPSGKGVHVLGYGELKQAIKKSAIEVYGEGRFFTVTGNHVEGTPLGLNVIQAVLNQLVTKYRPEDTVPAPPVREGYANKYDWRLEDIRKRDAKLDELLSGGLGGKPSPSEADMATLAKLLFWGYSEAEAVDILRAFRGREKLDRIDYITGMLRKLTVDKTIADSVDVTKWSPATGYRLGFEAGEEVYAGGREIPAATSGKADRYFDEGAFIPQLLADELMNEFTFATMTDSKEIYVYLDGYYQPLGEVLIKRECKRRLQDKYRKNRFGEVLDFIQASTFTKRREEAPNLIPLKNGVLNIDTMELRPVSPEYMFFNKIPVEYDPKADCPRIRKFFSEIVNGPEEVTVLEEVIGYCLYREYFITKALMLVGGGNNGKSTFLNLVKAFLGADNVSGRGLHEFEDNRFAKADLLGKLANIHADLPDRALYRTGVFKMLTGRDWITAEKKFQPSFSYQNYAKLLFSANKVPEALDDTDAFFRRWIIINFPNTFDSEDADPHILDKLATPEELSGLLNTALSRLNDLLRKGGFSFSKSTDALREEYIRKSSPIASFVMDCLQIDSDAFIVKKDLFNVFADYCRGHGIPCVTQDTFFKNLPQHVAVIDYRPKLHGGRPPTLKGIRYSLMSTLSEALSQKGAENGRMSARSSVSRVFFTLIEQRARYQEEGYRVEDIDDGSFTKVSVPLDTVDVGDKSQKTLSFDERSPETLDTKQKQYDSASDSQSAQEIPVRDKLKIILEKAQEISVDGVFSKFSVADALQGQMDRLEVFQLLSKLRDEGEFAMKDLESYVLAKPTPLNMKVQGRRWGQCKLHRTQYCPMAHRETIPQDGAYAETCQLFGPKETFTGEKVDETTGRGNEWDGFVAIGPMATPEKNYGQTIQALREFVELENRHTISKDELESPLKLYWAESSWTRVVGKLLDDGVLRRIDNGFEIDLRRTDGDPNPPRSEGRKLKPLCDRCFSQHRGAKIVSRPLPDYSCEECGDKATVMAEVLEE